MDLRAKRAAGLFLLSWAANLLPGCSPGASICSADQLDGCLPACDRGDVVACRTLGVALAQPKSSTLRAGAMLLEGACLKGDRASCERLSSLPVKQVTSASASAPRPPPAPLPCPSFAASAASAAASSGAGAPAAPVAPPVLTVATLPAEASEEARGLEARCIRGEGAACTQLAALLELGLGVPRSPRLTRDALVAGCERNDPMACRRAGRLLQRELPAQALAPFRRGCMGSDPGSCGALGELALQQVHPELTPPYGANQLRSACTNAYAPACRHLARLLREGTVLPRDEEAAARMEGRSLDLAQQSCTAGVQPDCLLLGLWQERPGVLGEEAGDSPRTTDTASLEGALAVYQKSCESRHAPACRRAIDLLDFMARQAPAEALFKQLDEACSSGDGPSCVELLALKRSPSTTALERGCGLAIPAACLALARTPTEGQEAALDKACKLGEPEGCDALLDRLAAGPLDQLQKTRAEVCERLGGRACVDLALAAPEEGCSRALLARACLDAPLPSAQGCAAAASLAQRQGKPAEELHRRACSLAPAGHLPENVGESCAHVARLLASEGKPTEALSIARKTCESGAPKGCLELALLSRSSDPQLSRESSEKACLRGQREACQLRFGPLPSPSPSPPRLPSAPDIPPPGCSLTHERSPRLPALLSLWAVGLLALRRRQR